MWAEYIQKINMFQREPTLTTKHRHKLTHICGGIISIPIIFMICVLFLLQFIQLVSRGVVYTSTTLLTAYQPPFTTFTTSSTESAYAPFMIAFAVTNDDTCSSVPIPLDVNVNLFNGAYNSSNRTTTKIPIKLETCNSSHFAMLPNSINKLSQYSSKSLACLPLNSYFDLGGANTLSSVYKTIKFNFTCPTSCRSSTTCGKVQFYVVNSQVNLGNSGNSNMFAYTLDRKVFSVQPNPAYMNYYQITTTNTTTDTSVLPFSTKNTVTSYSVANLLTDIPAATGQTSTLVIVQSSDKSTINQRSYYRLFDLLGYMGGIISGFYFLFFFIDYIIKWQFQMSFASEYFRNRDTKSYTIYGLMKQAVYHILKDTRWKPDWKVAEIREEMKNSVEKVLDVTYLNKRILFLEEAISLLFEPHQIKGIHLLHTLTREENEARINQHKLRDRLVCYLNKSWREQGEVYNFIKNISQKYFEQNQQQNGGQSGKMMIEKDLRDSDENPIKDFSVQTKQMHQIKLQVADSEQMQLPRFRRYKSNISIVHAIESHGNFSKKYDSDSGIIHEADEYYQSPEAIIENAQLFADRQQIELEMQYVGDLTPEEINQGQLVNYIENDLKKLMEEAEEPEGDPKSKLITQRFEGWLKHQLKLSIINQKKAPKRNSYQ